MVIGLEDWENRRPTELKTFPFEPNSLYVGKEGALSKITGETSEFIYQAEEGDDIPYSYISGFGSILKIPILFYSGVH